MVDASIRLLPRHLYALMKESANTRRWKRAVQPHAAMLHNFHYRQYA